MSRWGIRCASARGPGRGATPPSAHRSLPIHRNSSSCCSPAPGPQVPLHPLALRPPQSATKIFPYNGLAFQSWPIKKSHGLDHFITFHHSFITRSSLVMNGPRLAHLPRPKTVLDTGCNLKQGQGFRGIGFVSHFLIVRPASAFFENQIQSEVNPKIAISSN